MECVWNGCARLSAHECLFFWSRNEWNSYIVYHRGFSVAITRFFLIPFIFRVLFLVHSFESVCRMFYHFHLSLKILGDGGVENIPTGSLNENSLIIPFWPWFRSRFSDSDCVAFWLNRFSLHSSLKRPRLSLPKIVSRISCQKKKDIRNLFSFVTWWLRYVLTQ